MTLVALAEDTHMPGQKLTTENDSRFSYDQETGAVRSFFGAELVSKPAPDPDHVGASPDLDIAGFSVESEARDFLNVNQEKFKLEGITLKQSPDVREGAAVTSVQFQQYHFDVPVYGAELTVGFRASDGQALSAINSVDYSIPDSMRPEDVSLSREDAVEAVRHMLHNEVRKILPEDDPVLFVYRHSAQAHHPMPPSGRFRDTITQRGSGIEGKLYWAWQVLVETKAPDGNWEVLVDAVDGSIIAVFDRSRYSSPRAYVFLPDPITTSRNDGLSWDTDVLILDAERRVVPLEDLEPADETTGMCYLRGKWVNCVDSEKPNLEPPSSTGDFMYGSKDPAFLFAMTYYWTHELVKYLYSFNIPSLNKAISQIDVDAVGREVKTSTGGTVQLDNSFFVVSHGKPVICFGHGGVPDASDAHVIVHEYVHAVHHFLDRKHYSYEEGFADFLAAVWLDRYNEHLFQREEVFPWDGNNYPWAQDRKVNIGKRFDDPAASSYGRYLIGSIWAAGLWNLFIALGGDDNSSDTRIAAADTVVRLYLDMLVNTQSYASAEQLAGGLITADQGLNGNQGKYRKQICDAFAAKGVWNGAPPY